MNTTREELPKRYEPAEFEQRWYAHWEKSGLFRPSERRDAPSFSIVIPPPNVTGRLHLGHALDNTLIDILTRWNRMRGNRTLWLPGTDHAGIATQMVVERALSKEGLSRIEIGRDAFLERVWEWKKDNGDAIFLQLRRLGASADWSRERFTLDEGLSRAVRHVFVSLWEDGLIYRDLAMVNWCPRCRTAISDIEVDYRETNGHLYHIDYPIADGSGRMLTVATTRPETMLGDTGVAVHPEDDRYRELIGKEVDLPLTGRRIPIIGDPILVDREFGTGVVKVTPAHDRNDYDAGARNGLPQIKVIDEDGKMTAAAGEAFAGLDRFEARKAVVEALEGLGLLQKIENQMHAVGHCGKCDAVAEPMVSRQWFVKIEPLATPALAAVRDGAISIIPESWTSTYYNWMENIHDWCISRQLWWGHRIPAFYCECGKTVVSELDSPTCPDCGRTSLEQETDVLDTWFSSALWPFSTMGWPDDTDDLRSFYPTSVLVTGFDILFFWVARMIMMGLRFTGKAPFRHVYLHGLVRDEHGQKMSKSRGNVLDPLEVADEFGADAVRFTLAILSTGRDIPLARSRMQGYSAFANKIWNASRFALMHLDETIASVEPITAEGLSTVDRWILSRVNRVAANVDRSLEAFRFDEAAHEVYHFFWHEFCDWYIEMVKPVLLGRQGTDEERTRARRVLLEVLDRSLRLLHPFMPFITEEIWQKLGADEESIMVAAYPRFAAALDDPAAEERIGWLQQIATKVRNLRAESGFAPSERFRLFLETRDEPHAAFLRDHQWLLIELAKLSEVNVNGSIPDDAHRDTAGPIEFGIELPERAMPPEQIERTRKQIDELEREIGKLRGRLANPKFVERAPAHVVEQERKREADYQARLESLRQNLPADAS